MTRKIPLLRPPREIPRSRARQEADLLPIMGRQPPVRDASYASSFSTTFPPTSVSRKLRPW